MSTQIKHDFHRTIYEALLVAGIAVATLLFGIADATAQMDEPWQFKKRDRAGLAVVQKQADEGMFSSSRSSAGVNGSAGSSSQTLLFCGGGEGGTASATSNSSCIILNNTTGNLSVGQDSQGDQSAQSSAETTIGEVEEILNQSDDGPGSDISTNGN